MPDPRRHGGPFLLALTLVLLGRIAPVRGEPQSAPPEMLEDAELTDVFFVDVDRGCAVGDRGVILITDDGGRRWRLADCPVNCRLEAVFLVDERHGWAVGGWTHPYTHQSTGVVLRTENGGRRWTREAVATLPALKGVHFFDPRHGWALGSASHMYPSGLFRTQDGGRSWSPLPQPETGGWVAAHFLSRQEAVVLGRSATMALVSSGEQATQAIAAAGLRQARALRIWGAAGWIVGDGGMVLTSRDHGQSWQACSNLPRAAAEFDFSALAVIGPSIWIAGSPGSRIFHSPDSGETWEAIDRGESVPIKGLYFLDRDRGWSVGSLGTIMATRDGGRTWLRQRGQRRVALLGLFSEPQDVPLELLTRVSGDEGYSSVIEILTRRDIEVVEFCQSPREDRVHEAVVSAGGSGASSAWQFPLRQAGLAVPGDAIVRGWDTAHGDDGLRKLEEHLVEKIRQWRPDVVVTEHPSPRGDDPLAHLVNQVALAATQRAADATAYADQISHMRLQPWKVTKLLATAEEDGLGSLTLQTSRLATRLGRSLADYASQGRGLIHDEWSAAPQSLGFRLLLTELPRDLAARDFFSGITAAPGDQLRRPLGHAAAEDLQSLSKAAQKQRNIEQLLRQTADRQQDGAAWLAQVDDLTRGLTPSAAGQILYQLAQHYRVAGRYDLAAETLLLLVRQYGDHPLADTSLLWLVRYSSSSEAQWGLLGRAEQSPDDLTRTFKLGDFIAQSRPALYADPTIRLVVAAAERKGGAKHKAVHLWQQLSTSSLHNSWRQAARGELWLESPRGHAPRPTLNCTAAREKPYLDGKLDEAFWQAGEEATLLSALGDDGQWPANVRLAHDTEYLYLAVQCGKAAQARYAESDEPRPRDANLRNHDRVDLLLDVDRDYATYYRLTVDHRGWTGEACFGDSRWDPTWYVAAQADDSSWTVEAAIPLAALSPDLPMNETWAVGIQRTIPGVGFQSWTQPAAIDVRPAGFGHLRFDARRPK